MNATQMRTAFAVMAAALVWSASSITAHAQDRGVVALGPVVFRHNSGTETSRKTAIKSVEEILEKSGFTVLPNIEGERTWRRLNMPMVTEDAPARRRDLVSFGNAMHARYVLSPVFEFHSRSIWVDLGPRTDSTATMDVTITDVISRQSVYTRQNVTARSDEKFDAVKAGADLLFTPLVTIVSGGPKTPHEQRAVQIAVIRAMRGFVRPNDRGDDI